MIKIINLTVMFKNQDKKLIALDNINMKLGAGEICAVIGPSGCGKSTLLHVLAGIIKSYEGSVLVNEKEVNPRRQRIGFIPQSYGLMDWADVYSNAVIGLDISHGSYDKAYIEYILKELGLHDCKNKYPGRLSGGQRQRAAIARAFILKPELLLMDEPFSALDAITREDALELFFRVWKENSVTTLFVTHSIEEAVYIGKRIIILSPSPGRIICAMDNPLFGFENPRMKSGYYDLCMELRRKIKEEWSKC